jgi:hypothetical protein
MEFFASAAILPSAESDQAFGLPFVPNQNLGYCATHLSKREAKVWAR